MVVEAEALRQARIAIVDDEEPNVMLLEQMLGQAGYVNLSSTTDSSRAVDLCASVSPDLVLLDLMMPEPDGFQVMERLASQVADSWFPIVVLTADTNQEVRQRSLAGGAKDFLTKPFDRIEVLLRIENLLEIRFLQLELVERTNDLSRQLRQ